MSSVTGLSRCVTSAKIFRFGMRTRDAGPGFPALGLGSEFKRGYDKYTVAQCFFCFTIFRCHF